MIEREAPPPGGELAGQTVLVTGATGPAIASGLCDAIHAAGARLVVNGPTDDEVRATVARYPGAVGVAGDVSRPAEVERMFAAATELAGPLTGLVNNAGIGLVAHLTDVTDDQFDHVVGTDFRGVWLVSREFARAVLARGGTGAVVNVSSVHAARTIGGYGVYAAAKAGVEGLTRGFAVDLGPAGVRCNAVAPGYVPADRDLAPPDHPVHDTSWIDAHTTTEQALHRVIEPIDLGWAAVFLLSDRSRCITGQVLTVDAGLTALLYNADMATRIHADRRRRARAAEGNRTS
ncbi:SDR family NAD(P)-dependent oxidoreductase [Jiangella asiatica]|uniref:SDR family NAD(P)-dependent oxidoreductase n=1 Tax=Jiangella asiatica TaxID=2530372 RepID=UPI0013A5C408|nr:SDR family oxidoreductase [Jiangella asiatica]